LKVVIQFILHESLYVVLVRQAGCSQLMGRCHVERCAYTPGLRWRVVLLMQSGWWQLLSISFISTTNITRSVGQLCGR